MRRKLSRVAAGILAAAMIFSGNGTGIALAAENANTAAEVQEENDQQDRTQNDSVQSGTEDQKGEADQQKEPVEGEEDTDDVQEKADVQNQEDTLQQSDEVKGDIGSEESSKLSVNYFYLDKLSAYSGEKQSVVLSLGAGTEDINSVTLVYTDEAGNQYEWKSNKRNGELFLFERETGEEKGLYQFVSVKFTYEGQEENVVFAEESMEIYFGLNYEYDGNASSKNLEMESIGSKAEATAAVTTIDENGIANEQAEQKVSDALADLGAAAGGRSGFKSSGNVVVVLDPGHDAGHAGARGNDVQEEVATLKIAQYCKAELEQYSGITVYMTRTTGACPFPETVGANSGNILDIKKRVEWASKKGADVFVSFHLDSAGAAAHGSHVYYPGTWFANNNIVKEGADLAASIQKELVGVGLYDRGTESADYSVNTEAAKYGFAGLIIEHAFLTNASDANTYLKTEAGLKKLGVADANGIAKYFGLSKGQWVQSGDKWKYKRGDGTYAQSEWLNIGGKTYYIDAEGFRVAGWQEIDKNRYYFMPDGTVLTGWAYFGKYKYYFMPDGRMLTDWAYFGSRKYYFDAEGRMLTGWQDISGARYYFMPEGEMLTGWTYFGSKKYYFDSNGKMAVGTQNIDGKTYVFSNEGVLQESSQNGWVEKDGKRFYYKNGKMLTGWQDISGSRYYFMPDGYALTNWAYFGSRKYYFDNEGKMLTGWQNISGSRYYFMPEGEMLTGWAYFGSKKYCFNADGRMLTGWQDIGGSRYYFMPEGEMLTGWAYFGSRKYNFDTDGRMLRGWQDISGATYYFMPEGEMLTGWAYFGSKKYHFDTDGIMAVGTKTIDGKTYVFSNEGVLQESSQNGWVLKDGKKYYYKNGVMLTGWQNIEGERYYFMPDGYALTGWAYFGSKKYCFDAEGKMLTGWKDINGVRYYFMPEGQMLTGWAYFGSKKYYFDSSGKMATGKCYIDGTWYLFGEDGQLDTNYLADGYVIEGKSSVTANELMNYFVKKGKTYPLYYKDSDAPTLLQFCQLYCQEAEAEGIKVEVAFTQAMKETAWLGFGGDVDIKQYNFAGIGTTGGGVKGASFNSVKEGIQAQIQHLKAYGSTKPLNNACVDPRFGLVTRGCAIYVEWLGQQENPKGYGWATGKNYGIDIVKMIDDLKKQ